MQPVRRTCTNAQHVYAQSMAYMSGSKGYSMNLGTRGASGSLRYGRAVIEGRVGTAVSSRRPLACVRAWAPLAARGVGPLCAVLTRFGTPTGRQSRW